MIDIDKRRQLQQPPGRQGIETKQNLRGRRSLGKIKYRLKHRGVRLTSANGMALTDTDEFHGPVKPGQERLDNCRLANAGLTADQHQLTATRLCRRQGGPQRGKFGTVGRNQIVGPSFQQWDMSFFKNFAITERVNVQFRAESFNIANNVNLLAPDTTFVPGPNGRNRSATFGTITRARDARVVQLGLKLIF